MSRCGPGMLRATGARPLSLLKWLAACMVGADITPVAAQIAGQPAAPNLPFHAGGLAVLAVGFVMLFVAGVWTVFVAGIWTSNKKRQQARLRQRELQLDLAFDNISQGVCMLDAQARIVVCNRAFINLYGLSPDVVKPGCTLPELLRHRAEVGLLNEDPEQYARDILASIEKGETTTWLLETRDGRFVHAINHPIAGGGWVTTHEDVTQRRRAELAVEGARAEAERAKAELQVTHRRLREAFEAVPEGLVLFDSEDRLVMWNKRYAKMYPATSNIVHGTRFEDVLWDGIANGQYPAAKGREQEFVAQRLAQH